MIRPSRRIAVLALCAMVAGSAVLAAKPRATRSPDSSVMSKGVPAGVWDTVWSFLVSVWPKNGSAGDTFGGPKNGPGMDPFGKPLSGQPNGDNGSQDDPDGY